MATFGVEFTIGLPAAIELSEENLDQIYTSLSLTMSVVSADLAWTPERGRLAALVGVTTPDGFESEEFATGIATDAFKKALADCGLTLLGEDDGLTPSSRVEEYAA